MKKINNPIPIKVKGNKEYFWCACGKSAFVVVGTLGTVLTSSDLTTWTSRTSNTSNNLLEVSYKE